MNAPNWLPASWLLVVWLAFSIPVQSQCDYSRLPPRLAEIARSAQERVTKGELPSIAFAIAQHGKIVCQEAFGFADRENRIPATARTTYAAGSVAKSVTSAAVYMLASQGKLRLDDSPQRYGVPVRTHNGPDISIRQLLSMTAGIQHGWFYNYTGHIDRRQLLRDYAISAFPPGQHFIYSNFSYGILGAVVENASKRPFSEFVRAQLLDPLWMTSSGFNLTGRNVAVGYQAGKPVPAYTFEPEAGGGFYTSAHDLALFGLFQLDPGQKLIAPVMMRQMHTLETAQQKHSRYTSGWGILSFHDGSSVLISNGRVLAGSATLLLLPKTGTAIACLTNVGSEAMDDLAFQLGDLFSSGLLADLDSARKEVEASEQSQPFHANQQQLGTWLGTVDTPKGNLPVRLLISADDHIQMGIGDGAMVPVEHSGVAQGFLSGDAGLKIALPQTGTHPSKLQLDLLWVGKDRLVGTARSESVGDLPAFGLPLYLSLSKP